MTIFFWMTLNEYIYLFMYLYLQVSMHSNAFISCHASNSSYLLTEERDEAKCSFAQGWASVRVLYPCYLLGITHKMKLQPVVKYTRRAESTSGSCFHSYIRITPHDRDSRPKPEAYAETLDFMDRTVTHTKKSTGNRQKFSKVPTEDAFLVTARFSATLENQQSCKG